MILLFISLSSMPDSRDMQGLEGRENLKFSPVLHPALLTLNGPWEHQKGAIVSVVLVTCALWISVSIAGMATLKFRGHFSPECNSLSPNGLQQSGHLEPSSLLRFLGFFPRAIPIRRDNQPWIWHMYINLSLSLFYINHDPPINTGGLLCVCVFFQCELSYVTYVVQV